MKLTDLGANAAALVALAGSVAILWKGSIMVFRAVRRVARMADEVLGDGERPGWGPRLTGMEALGRTNAARLTAIESSLSQVRAEVNTNGGNSLKDQVTRIEQATGAERAAQG